VVSDIHKGTSGERGALCPAARGREREDAFTWEATASATLAVYERAWAGARAEPRATVAVA
jgi:hypothetical protein